ncbi:MAG: hypothetical protein NXY57DRAFT_967436 [Lentinula lateritia]|nr:MAG: hypothetical protein NXY57DRAFT_967436 [Lentinula lateritia]
MAMKWTELETWGLITQIKVVENFKNSSGDTKNAVHQRIAAALWPGGDGDITKMASRVKNRITWLEKTFKDKVKLLKKTGEGVEEWHYIAPSGPDHDTDQHAVSIWDRIRHEFKYFPDLYRIWSTKPNLVPICATTGVGPNRSEFVLIQQTSTKTIPSQPSPPPATPDVLMLVPSSSDPFSSGGSNDSPINSPSTPSSAHKENVEPPPSSQRPPRSSAFSSLAPPVNGDKVPITVPQKLGFEDKMIGLQQEMMKSMEKQSDDAQTLKRLREERKMEDQRLKHRKLLQDGRGQLLAEFQAGLWTAEQYREERKKLDMVFSTPQKPRHVPPPPPRAPSPDWDENLFDDDLEGEES